MVVLAENIGQVILWMLRSLTRVEAVVFLDDLVPRVFAAVSLAAVSISFWPVEWLVIVLEARYLDIAIGKA